jgi:hypothetical protein
MQRCRHSLSVSTSFFSLFSGKTKESFANGECLSRLSLALALRHVCLPLVFAGFGFRCFEKNAIFILTFLFFFCSQLFFSFASEDMLLGVFLVICSTLSPDLFSTVGALQFLRTTQSAGHIHYSSSVGIDFTVQSAIDVSAIGIVDTDAPGFAGTPSAQIVDRTNDQVVVGPVIVNASDFRKDDANPFAFQNVTVTRLLPGVYCLTSIGFGVDKILTSYVGPGSVVAGDSGGGAVMITAAGEGGAGLLSSTLTSVTPGYFYAGATFLFKVAPVPPAPPVPAAVYTDCEQVTCAGLKSGMHNIQGQARFCDTEMAGGGWLRLWRANESTCEQNGWSSARNPSALGVDPFGCRPGNELCTGKRIDSPFAFVEVRGGNWIVWAQNSPNGFDSISQADGVLIRDGGGALVWTLIAGSAVSPAMTCPCSSTGNYTASPAGQRNENSTGAFYSCDRHATRSTSWIRLFQYGPFHCSGLPSGDLLWFQRTLASPQRAVVIAICKDEVDRDEDLKLSSGDLYVRAKPGFDKTRDCPTTTTTSTATSRTTTTTSADKSTRTTSITSATATIPADGASPVDNTVWIVPTAVAVVLALALCGVVAYLLQKSKRNKQQKIEMNTARDASQSERAPGYSIPSPPASSLHNYDQVPPIAVATSDSIKPW